MSSIEAHILRLTIHSSTQNETRSMGRTEKSLHLGVLALNSSTQSLTRPPLMKHAFRNQPKAIRECPRKSRIRKIKSIFKNRRDIEKGSDSEGKEGLRNREQSDKIGETNQL